MSMHSNHRKGILNNLFCIIRISSPYTICIFCIYLYLLQIRPPISSLPPDFGFLSFSARSLLSLSRFSPLLSRLSHSLLSPLALSLLSLSSLSPLISLSLLSLLSFSLSFSLSLSLSLSPLLPVHRESHLLMCFSVAGARCPQWPTVTGSSQTYGREQHWHAGPFRCGTLAPYHPTAQ